MTQQTPDRARFEAWFATLQDAGADFAWEAWQAATALERERIGGVLLAMHERDRARHNYWLYAWQQVQPEAIRSQP